MEPVLVEVELDFGILPVVGVDGPDDPPVTTFLSSVSGLRFACAADADAGLAEVVSAGLADEDDDLADGVALPLVAAFDGPGVPESAATAGTEAVDVAAGVGKAAILASLLDALT